MTEHTPLTSRSSSLPRMVPLSHLAQGGRWRTEALRSHDEAVLYWFTRGQGRITTGTVTHGYGPHNAILLPAGILHGFEAGMQMQGSALFFGAAGDQLGLPEQPLHLRLREVTQQGEMTHLLDRLKRELDTPDLPGHAGAVACHLGLISVWMARRPEAQIPRLGHSAARHISERFLAALARDFHRGQGVADYARALGITPTHLTRAVRSSCGRSAHEMLQERRLYEARRLLADTDVPVGKVAKAAGFSSPAYFARAFAQETGHSPSDFRAAG